MKCNNCQAFLGDYEAVFEPTQFRMRHKPEKCPVCSAPTPLGTLIKKKGAQYVRLNIKKQWWR